MAIGAWTRSIRSVVARVYPQLERKAPSKAAPMGTSLPLDEYVDSMPSAQHAVDLIPGWNCRRRLATPAR